MKKQNNKGYKVYFYNNNLEFRQSIREIIIDTLENIDCIVTKSENLKDLGIEVYFLENNQYKCLYHVYKDFYIGGETKNGGVVNISIYIENKEINNLFKDFLKATLIHELVHVYRYRNTLQDGSIIYNKTSQIRVAHHTLDEGICDFYTNKIINKLPMANYIPINKKNYTMKKICHIFHNNDSIDEYIIHYIGYKVISNYMKYHNLCYDDLIRLDVQKLLSLYEI